MRMSVNSIASSINIKNLWKYKGDEGMVMQKDDSIKQDLRKKLAIKLERIVDEDEEPEDRIMRKSSSSKGKKKKVESSEINNYWEKASNAADVDRVEAAINERMDDIAH